MSKNVDDDTLQYAIFAKVLNYLDILPQMRYRNHQQRRILRLGNVKFTVNRFWRTHFQTVILLNSHIIWRSLPFGCLIISTTPLDSFIIIPQRTSNRTHEYCSHSSLVLFMPLWAQRETKNCGGDSADPHKRQMSNTKYTHGFPVYSNKNRYSSLFLRKN